MSPSRFRDCVAALGWTLRGLAAILQCDDRIIRRWASGDADIPPSVATWLETLAKTHEALPPPQGWKRRAGGLTPRQTKKTRSGFPADS